jgi:DNA repair exonuclease SbcCD ATPase subunit/exonuclease VII small subunit
MIKIRNLTIKNFMSVGNCTQAVNFNRGDLTLVLGENLDLGSNGSRNGCGKTTLINALSYALYGSAISDIKVNNLINKTNEKNMLVSIEFDIDLVEYRVERGRKPNLLKFYKNNVEIKDDEAQGDSRETQQEINHLLGISHNMFKHAVALNTYTEPFLSMGANDQKTIIEQLLGITILTEKAELLKVLNKETKDLIKEEEYRLTAVIKANEHISEQITSLERRQRMWRKKKDEDISVYVSAIEKLREVDADTEIQSHKDNVQAREDAKSEFQILKDAANCEHSAAMEKYFSLKDEVTKFNSDSDVEIAANQIAVSTYNAAILECTKWINQLEADQLSLDRRSTALEKAIQLIDEHKCHACGHELHNDKQEENKAAKWKELSDVTVAFEDNAESIMEYKLRLAELGPPPEVNSVMPSRMNDPAVPVEREVAFVTPVVKETFYNTIDEAHSHKSSLDTLTTQLATAVAYDDPYLEQIADMQLKGLQDVTYDRMNHLVDVQEHQAFLYKLLTSKDSFIRKKIIEQNLSYLNNRLSHYLTEIGLPHQVRFLSDLSVEIADLGRDLDFDNLSRGERNRLILSLSWAFRDVFESLYSQINLLFVDELVDNGLDSNGVEAAIGIMKRMARERGKSVWLVSHRDELISRVHNTMTVIKENGFTTFDSSIE